MTTLTKAQLKFFSKPRTMEEIRTILFGGDDWGANTFQNDQISAGNLEICTVDGKIATCNGYDYYEGRDRGTPYYCLVPEGGPAPAGGYYSHEYACAIKNSPNLFI